MAYRFMARVLNLMAATLPRGNGVLRYVCVAILGESRGCLRMPVGYLLIAVGGVK